MKRIKGFWMVAAVCCVALVAACADDDDYDDEPVPSTVDTAEWPIAGYMDTLTYRAGDDFFMYCNGNYWKNTDLEGQYIKGFTYTECSEKLNQRISETDFQHETKLIELAKAVMDKPMTEEEMDHAMAPVMQLINSAETSEDCIRLMARLYKMGYTKLFTLNFKIVDGVYKPVLGVVFSLSNQAVMAEQAIFAPSEPTQQELFEHPELLDDYHPLADTRGEGNDVVTWLTDELGLSAQDVQVSDEDVECFATYLKASVEELKGVLAKIVRCLDQPYMNPELVEASYGYMRSYTPGDTFEAWVQDIYYSCRYTSSYVFATQWITQQMIDDMTRKCEEMRSVFRRRIADLDWMSGTAKERAIEKLDLVNVNVGYPKNWVNEAMVDFSQCQTLIEAVRMAREADAALQFSYLGKDIQTHSFNALLHISKSFIDLRTLNAFYTAQFNCITILPGFMLPPLYDLDAHEALQYATLFTIGHELTHGFDSGGANYDGLGNYRNWWTVQDRMDFEERYQRLIDCYNRLEMLPWDPDYAGKYCPGEQTLRENIADLGGFEIARQAYIEQCQREGYYGEELDNQERKFYQAVANYWRAKYGSDWIEYALVMAKDSHAMLRERINGVVMNTDRWYELYNVQWGDNLYLRPEKRTHIW